MCRWKSRAGAQCYPTMARRRVLLSFVVLLFLSAAKQRAVQHPRLLPPADVFSAANTSAVTTRHLALDLTVDFELRRLSGSATLTLENFTGAKELVLDTYGMTIESVTLDAGAPAQWRFGTQRQEGTPLIISIQPSTRTVTIRYTTMSDAPGLYWNRAEQSYGRKEPYLYSLNEPIQARAWIPIQDTPATRMTWEATLRVPPQLLALMSAENNPNVINPSGVYTFRMTRTMPAYLIALAVGRLEFQPLDERTGVYAEPELMSDAEWELQYVPEMVDVAETIAGPYPFDRYDILLMPPTFVVGGMEHPMLNFLNPFSVVSGNRPAKPDPKPLIAHELAHSWSGDKVTLSNWNDVWLNEGITSYLTQRIMEEMVDEERVELSYFLDRRSYESYVAQLLKPELSVLHRAVDWPGSAFDSTAYTKGELFLRTLEDRLGRPTLDAFLRLWFDAYAWRWVDDRTFVATLTPFAAGREDLRLEEWLYAPGLPSNVTAPTSSAIYTRALDRAQAFHSGTPIGQLSPATWTDVDIEQFLSVVPQSTLRARMAEVDAALGLSVRVTPPLSWMVHAGHASYAPARPAIERALMRGGPNSWITQLYNSLRWTPENRAFALGIFARARKRYHPSIEQNVERMFSNTGSAVRDAA